MVLYSFPPRRMREVCIREFGSELTMRTVAHLGETVDASRLRQLISGDQIAVSKDGLFSTHIITFRRGAELVVHSEMGVLKPHFQRLSPQEGSRILVLGKASVLVWGKVDGYPTGLWRMGRYNGEFIAPFSKLTRSNGLIRGISKDQPRKSLYLMPSGFLLWPVQGQALVAASKDGLCVVEEIGGLAYAYEVSEQKGVSSYRLLTLSQTQRPVGIVHWRGRLMLAVRCRSQSWLVELNRKSSSETPVRIQIDGDLHGVWSSPRSEALLILVHPRGEPDYISSLQLSDGRTLYEGQFSMDASSMTWSPNEHHLAVRVREGDGSDQTRERLVGTAVNHLIALGLHLREYVIDDRGQLAAAIQHDGIYDQPLIGGRAGTKVPLAWNLHHDQEGRVVWTTIQDDRILTWTQRR